MEIFMLLKIDTKIKRYLMQIANTWTFGDITLLIAKLGSEHGNFACYTEDCCAY